jgi:UDP-N-acetyl-D-glucosamine dehydrogenase
MKGNLISKFERKTAVIGIVGLGYVGLPLAIRYTEVGYKVIGFDIDESKTECISKGESYIGSISDQVIQRTISSGFEVTADFSRATDVDAIILCVPTPLNSHREPDLSFIIETMNSLLPHIKQNQVISLESTTYPGTTEEELKPMLEKAGYIVGQTYYLVYSPEREDPGNTNYTTKTIPKVVGGTTKECLNVGIALYEKVIDHVVPVSSTQAAEMTKLLENIHRAVNIGLVNEMKIVADKMGIDIYEVIKAAATKPFGFVPYYPGPGLGGHCIPIDPFYLTWKAKEYGMTTRFIELAGEVNSMMPNWVVEKVVSGLNKYKKAVNGSRILVLGLAYKKNVGDTRESPSIAIMELLREKGALVEYSDPYVPVFPQTRKHDFDQSSVELTVTNIEKCDALIVATNHDAFDYDLVLKTGKLIIDTRGVYKEVVENVISA